MVSLKEPVDVGEHLNKFISREQRAQIGNRWDPLINGANAAINSPSMEASPKDALDKSNEFRRGESESDKVDSRTGSHREGGPRPRGHHR